jgi:hypothetical protein
MLLENSASAGVSNHRYLGSNRCCEFKKIFPPVNFGKNIVVFYSHCCYFFQKIDHNIVFIIKISPKIGKNGQKI